MTAAARQKRRRTREALGLAVYGVEVGGDVLTELAAAGLVAERDLDDRKRVAAGLASALANWAENNLASRVTSVALGRPYDARRKERMK